MHVQHDWTTRNYSCCIIQSSCCSKCFLKANATRKRHTNLPESLTQAFSSLFPACGESLSMLLVTSEQDNEMSSPHPNTTQQNRNTTEEGISLSPKGQPI